MALVTTVYARYASKKAKKADRLMRKNQKLKSFWHICALVYVRSEIQADGVCAFAYRPESGVAGASSAVALRPWMVEPDRPRLQVLRLAVLMKAVPARPAGSRSHPHTAAT